MRACFQDLPLHDAVLESIELMWEQASCRLNLEAFVQRGARAVPYALEFQGITRLVIPRAEPWGSSVFVNRATEQDGTYLIEMQSGDEFEITASGFTFVAL